jgi:hypothetical protein
LTKQKSEVEDNSPNQNLSLKETEPVNVQIRTHETQIKDWELAEKAQELYLWYDRLENHL